MIEIFLMVILLPASIVLNIILIGRGLNVIKENEKLSYDMMNRLKEFEFQVELNKTYLVQQNYRLIQDGDILISDMYLSEERIHRLLDSAGYDKHTKVYVSNGGKREGW
jgi:predicted HAD superfamily hydrolase